MKKNTATFIGIVTLLLLSPSLALANESLYDATAVISVKVNPELHRPTTIRLQGPVEVRTNEIGDLDGDGLPDIQTEILSMNLAGNTPQGLAINLNSSKSNRSIGMAEQKVKLPIGARGANPTVANSFFDVFVELTIGRHTPFHNCVDEPVHLQTTARSLTDLSGVYRMSGKIALCDLEGQPVGSLSIPATNLNSSRSN